MLGLGGLRRRGAAGLPQGDPGILGGFRDGAALRAKSGQELARALLVLGLCGLPGFVRSAPSLLWVSRRVLGRRLWGGLLRASFYGQFVAGATPAEVGVTTRRLQALGLRPMLALPFEEDVGGPRPDGERWYEGNGTAARGCVELSAQGGPRPMMQLKVTALMSAHLCKTMSGRLAEPGGTSELSLDRVVAAMAGEDPQFPWLSPEQNQHLGAALARLDGVAQLASQRGVRVLVDAEQTYVNPALGLVTLALMARWNRDRAWVWNTYQAYLQDCRVRLQQDAGAAERGGFCFGVKLVRGAYLQQERGLARAQGCPDPAHPNWEATNASYDACLDLALERAAQDGQRFELIVATHNEASVRHAVRRMAELGIPEADGGVCFGQLLGMCDHVSLALGQAGYAVYKSVPYGPIEGVLPYLVRRAQENRSVLAGARAERALLTRELCRRLLRRP